VHVGVGVDCAASTGGYEAGLRLVDVEGCGGEGIRATTEFDHYGAEDCGHALGGLVCVCHV
jgi:hypothetical protein